MKKRAKVKNTNDIVLADTNKEKKIKELRDLQSEYFDKAYEIRDEIDKLLLDGINYEGKILQKVEFGEERCEYLIVRNQIFGPDRRVFLSGLCFYANFNEGDAEMAEVFFNGYHSWIYDFDEFLTLSEEGKSKSVKVLDKDTFIEKIKGYTKSLENFINGWVKKTLNSVTETKSENE